MTKYPILKSKNKLNNEQFLYVMQNNHYCFLLSKANIELSIEEVRSLFKVNEYRAINNLLIINLKNKKVIEKYKKRLAYTKKISEFIFETNKAKLFNRIRNYNWCSVYKKNFCIRVYNENKQLERDIADVIWKKLKNPKVRLKNSETEIEFYFFDDKVYCSKLLYVAKDKPQLRRAHLRPELHPSSLHPKLARCLINLSGVKNNETILDPFCGSGGILIEAGLMNIKSLGYDLDGRMLEKAENNLNFYKIKNYKLKLIDFFKIKEKFDYIVTDLPYGLNSNILIQNKQGKWPLALKREGDKKLIDKFFSDVLINLSKTLKKRAVIIIPDFIDYKKHLKKTKLKIMKEFEMYVHKSLTRKIVVLEK